MVRWYRDAGICFGMFMAARKKSLLAFVRGESGDLVSSLGWMAVMALALILIKGIVDGGLSRYATNIFTHLDRVFGP